MSKLKNDTHQLPTRDVVLVVLGAVAAVVIAVVLADDARAVWAPAIAIGAVVMVAELSLESARRRNDVLVRKLDQRAPERKPAEQESPRPVRDDVVAEKVAASAVPTPFRQFLAVDRRQDDPQCPRCGRFLVDVASQHEHSFRCRACGMRWEWQGGRPWPDVVVVPDLRELPGDRSASRLSSKE